MPEMPRSSSPLGAFGALAKAAHDMARTVLIVDDSGLMRSLIRSALESLRPGRFDIVEAASAWDGLTALSAHPVELLVTDFVMPTMNGSEFVQRVRQHAHEAIRNVPIIMLSSSVEARQKARTQPSGLVAFIAKPFRPAELVDLVDGVLGSTSLRPGRPEPPTETGRPRGE